LRDERTNASSGGGRVAPQDSRSFKIIEQAKSS
jgi:hypothetical protein